MDKYKEEDGNETDKDDESDNDGNDNNGDNDGEHEDDDGEGIEEMEGIIGERRKKRARGRAIDQKPRQMKKMQVSG